MTAPAPVLPVAMIGTFHVLPAGRRVPRRGHVEVHIGPAIDLTAHDDQTGASRQRALTDDIMLAIGKLSNQPYVELYAQQIKAELGIAGRR